MHILYLAHRVPFPPNKGDKIRSYHHVRHLAARHTLHLLSFFDHPEDADAAAVLRQHCAHVSLVPLRPRVALAHGIAGLAAGRSLSEGYYGAPAMWRLLRGHLADRRFDAAWGFSSVMAMYVAAVPARLRVVDFADVDSEKWRQLGSQSRRPLRWVYELEARRLHAFENRVGSWADRSLFATVEEAGLFRRLCPQARDVRVVQNGVDLTYFDGTPAPPAGHAPTVLFTGALDYRPNIDAVLYFARDVLPLVRREFPTAQLVAVGHRPAPRLLHEAAAFGDAVHIAGSVPDVRPFFRTAHVYIAPLQLGRGVQNKVLEAMAMRVPVVATPVAAEGLAAEAGRHLLIADTPARFADAVRLLLRDPERRQHLATAARDLVQRRYVWSANLAELDVCLADAASGQAA